MVALSKLVEAAAHPSEVVPLVKMALAAKRARALPQGEALAFCYGMLNRVSRR
jgi:farnesyl-diphosphate farnesyltransferase